MAIGLILSLLLDAPLLPLPAEAMDDTTSEFNIAQCPAAEFGIAPHSHADERALTMRAFYAQPCILSHGSLDPISARVQPFPLFR
jgi:hypothetical protein